MHLADKQGSFRMSESEQSRYLAKNENRKYVKTRKANFYYPKFDLVSFADGARSEIHSNKFHTACTKLKINIRILTK